MHCWHHVAESITTHSDLSVFEWVKISVDQMVLVQSLKVLMFSLTNVLQTVTKESGITHPLSCFTSSPPSPPDPLPPIPRGPLCHWNKILSNLISLKNLDWCCDIILIHFLKYFKNIVLICHSSSAEIDEWTKRCFYYLMVWFCF